MVLTHVPGLGTGFIQEPCLRVPNGPLMCSVIGCNGQMSSDMMLLLLMWRGAAQKGLKIMAMTTWGRIFSASTFQSLITR